MYSDCPSMLTPRQWTVPTIEQALGLLTGERRRVNGATTATMPRNLLWWGRSAAGRAGRHRGLLGRDREE